MAIHNGIHYDRNENIESMYWTRKRKANIEFMYWTRKRKANIENTTNAKHVSHEKYQQPMRELMDESKIYNENVKSQDIFNAVWKCFEIGFFFLNVLGVKRFTQFLITKHKLLPEKRQWEKKLPKNKAGRAWLSCRRKMIL